MRAKIIVSKGLTNLLKDSILSIDTKIKILKELKTWMMENDRTVLETAKELGIHFTTLSRLLNGKNIPYDRTAYKIKEFLKKHKAL